MVRLRRVAGLAGLLLLAGCFGRVTDSPAPVDQSAPGRWAALTPLPAPRQEVAVAAWRGHVWVIGGFGDNAEPVANPSTPSIRLNALVMPTTQTRVTR